MIDLKITEDVDVLPDDTGDLPIVSGVDAYNQTIALAAMEAFYTELGSLDKESALGVLEESAREVAREFPQYIDRVQSITVEYTDEAETAAVLYINYVSGEVFQSPSIQ